MDYDSIVNGMMYPFWQLMDRIYWKYKWYRFPPFLLLLVYVVMGSIMSFIFLVVFRIVYSRKMHEVITIEVEFIIIPPKQQSTPEENRQIFLELTEYTPLPIKIDVTVPKQLIITVDNFDPIFRDIMNRFGRISLRQCNAGGTSEVSEAWSIHHLSNKLMASKCHNEMEVEYWIEYKMVDYVLKVNKTNVGVSVVRALCFYNIEFTREEGIRLLQKKIYGLIVSRQSVNESFEFYRSILHIWSPSDRTTQILQDCLNDPSIKYLLNDLVGTLDIWITTSSYKPIFNNGNNRIFLCFKPRVYSSKHRNIIK